MVKIRKKPIKSLPKKEKSKTMKVKKNKIEEDLASVSSEEVLNEDFQSSDVESEKSVEEAVSSPENSDSEQPNQENDDAQSEPEDLDSGDEIESHKKALSKLQNTDPEFYKFLQENDKKLLQFDVSDDEESEGENQPHKPPNDLELASDESDFEDENATKARDPGKITLKLLKTWQKNIQSDKTNKTITSLIQAFHAALLQVSPDEDQESSIYQVEGSAVFNGVIQLCVIHLGPALQNYLGISQDSKQPPHKSKRFVKIRRPLKSYITDLLKLLSGVSSANIQTVLLKHLHYMSPFIFSYPNITKSILKRLISIWGSASEGVRVIAFFCILRITNGNRVKFLDTVLKLMYMTYVKNSKFVSVSALASINFMRRSLVEMFALDVNVAYQHVFLYIRQLAIHLRNAITVNKKENVHAVYNWQFVNSLKLWGNLLAVTCNKPQLQQLVYPFVQVCLGTLKLVPTAQYYPLRFHVVQILIDLSRDTGVFIPILPFLLEVLNSYDFNKKHQKVSMKPPNFTCLLRASKSEMTENGFKDVIIETIYGQLLEYLASQSHSIAFPDLSLFCTIQIKMFVKKCANANYNRKMKQILEKIEHNNQFIESERRKITVNITDFKQIEGWESQIKNKGTPLATFFESWSKLNTIKKNKRLTNNEELGDYNLPVLKKQKTVKEKSDGPVVLFPSDSEDSDIGFEKEVKEVKRKRGKRGGKNVAKKVVEENHSPDEDTGERDLVEDLKMSDW